MGFLNEKLTDINTRANKVPLSYIELETQTVEEFKHNHKETNPYNKTDCLSVSGSSPLG